MKLVFQSLSLILPLLGLACNVGPGADTLLNVSYDVAREFYADYNRLFAEHYKSETGKEVRINQSHAGSTKQARAVIDGLNADVVTMNQPTDLDTIAERGRNLVAKNWREKFPKNAAPSASTIVFLVRQGNPKAIHDWDDLARSGVIVIVPNPKVSGNGRYSYLSMWAYGAEQCGADEQGIKKFLTQVFENVPVLDSGSRSATTTFVKRGIGDVLLTFEAEALTTLREVKSGQFELVYPSMSVEAEMPVAIVERVVDRRGTRAFAESYLEFLYSEPAQELFVRHGYRPVDPTVAARNAGSFGELKLIKVEDAFGSWTQAFEEHFSEGGTFDEIYAARGR